jgi:hypothetical protein
VYSYGFFDSKLLQSNYFFPMLSVLTKRTRTVELGAGTIPSSGIGMFET